jgi:hypothetical protein
MTDGCEEYVELDFLELDKKTIEPLLDDDEISAGEAGFMEGYCSAS